MKYGDASGFSHADYSSSEEGEREEKGQSYSRKLFLLPEGGEMGGWLSRRRRRWNVQLGALLLVNSFSGGEGGREVG